MRLRRLSLLLVLSIALSALASSIRRTSTGIRGTLFDPRHLKQLAETPTRSIYGVWESPPKITRMGESGSEITKTYRMRFESSADQDYLLLAAECKIEGSTKPIYVQTRSKVKIEADRLHILDIAINEKTVGQVDCKVELYDEPGRSGGMPISMTENRLVTRSGSWTRVIH